MLLAHMQRPDRIHAWTMPSSWPLDRSEDVVITRARCKNTGVRDHNIIDFPNQSYASAYKPQIEYGGTPLSSTQAYIFGICDWIRSHGNRYPLISGSCGDITAGSGVARVLETFDVRQTTSNRERFKIACYCQSKEWYIDSMRDCLYFDPVDALDKAGLRDEWACLWDETEGWDIGVRVDLIRLRNRGSQYITYAWAAADLWGGYVSPYTDTDYVRTMLSLPLAAREKCIGQRRYGQKYFPHILPNARVPRTAWDVSNTLNKTTVSEAALWPLVASGAKPRHHYFKPAAIQTLYSNAMHGYMQSFFMLHSLQPLAWCVDKGYVL